jgi:hypothetical protein
MRTTAWGWLIAITLFSTSARAQEATPAPLPPDSPPQSYAPPPPAYAPPSCVPCPPPPCVQPCVPCPQACPTAAPPVGFALPPGTLIAAAGIVREPPGRDWRFVLEPDGSLWRERTVRKTGAAAAIVGAGIVFVPWIYQGVFGLFSGDKGVGFVPVFGAFIDAANATGSIKLAYAFGGLAQAAGLTMLIAGASKRARNEVERKRVQLSIYPGGLSGRF